MPSGREGCADLLLAFAVFLFFLMGVEGRVEEAREFRSLDLEAARDSWDR
jgi:hypothetical protein